MTNPPDDGVGTAVCIQCGNEQPLELFHRERSRPNGRNRRCKTCRNARNREHVAKNRERRLETMARWRRDNPERYEQAQRAYKLRGYGLTIAAFDNLLRAQGGLCAICRRAESRGWDLAVDHDHTTGAVRGLLCRRCNAALGLLRDDPVVLAAAEAYLRMHRA